MAVFRHLHHSYQPGDNKAICDICGFAFLRSECKLNWKRQLVCDGCWEPRHPQDYVRSTPDMLRVKDARSPGTDVFLDPGDVTADDL